MKRIFYPLLLLIFHVSSAHAVEQLSEEIATNKYQYAVKVWIHNGALFTSTKLPQANWSAGTPLASTNVVAAKVALDDFGNSVAIWQASNSIYAACLPFQGSPSQVVELARSSSHPQIAMNNSGQTVAVWAQTRIVFW